MQKENNENNSVPPHRVGKNTVFFWPLRCVWKAFSPPTFKNRPTDLSEFTCTQRPFYFFPLTFFNFFFCVFSTSLFVIFQPLYLRFFNPSDIFHSGHLPNRHFPTDIYEFTPQTFQNVPHRWGGTLLFFLVNQINLVKSADFGEWKYLKLLVSSISKSLDQQNENNFHFREYYYT